MAFLHCLFAVRYLKKSGLEDLLVLVVLLSVSPLVSGAVLPLSRVYTKKHYHPVRRS